MNDNMRKTYSTPTSTAVAFNFESAILADSGISTNPNKPIEQPGDGRTSRLGWNSDDWTGIGIDDEENY